MTKFHEFLLENDITLLGETFIPPKSLGVQAKKALKWKEEHGDEVNGGTAVGWTRAHQLANGKPLSLRTVERMHSFFSRHQAYQDKSEEQGSEPWKEASVVSWLIWGGDAGKEWSAKIAEKYK